MPPEEPWLPFELVLPFGPSLEPPHGAGVANIHSHGANIVFCDGHVEYAKQQKWLQATEAMRRRWNNDHEAHPETWSTNVSAY